MTYQYDELLVKTLSLKKINEKNNVYWFTLFFCCDIINW